ncbi:MAG: hypothetical protein K8W52_25545 [Deltaproteobacteria bacterium]|nr:hypothetical protein [Deltaproteobacteria bacterium]
MRLACTVSLLLAACPGATTPPPAAPRAKPPRQAAAARTVVDHPDLTLTLPGHWDERAVEGGYDLTGGHTEEVIVVLFPLAEGDDVEHSATRLGEAQRTAMRAVCKDGFELAPSTDDTRFYATCTTPRFVATLVASPQADRVLSYEHYRYDVTALTPELDAADAAIYATVRVRASCPPAIVAAFAQNGACLEPKVLGPGVTDACRAELQKRGWQRDATVETALHEQTGEAIECYRAAP